MSIVQDSTTPSPAKTAASQATESLSQQLDQTSLDETETFSIVFEDNLKYQPNEANAQAPKPVRVCSRFTCRKMESEESPFKNCSKCGCGYCSRECQVAHWKSRHKKECPIAAKIRNGESLAEHNQEILARQLHRVENYICPFAVTKYDRLGKGLVFIRATSDLPDWNFWEPVNQDGIVLNRYLQVQYLTLPEFDGLAFEDDFELAVVRPTLEEQINAYNAKEHIIVLILLQCGYLACAKMAMRPRYEVGKLLGKSYEYADKEIIQLNFDTQDD